MTIGREQAGRVVAQLEPAAVEPGDRVDQRQAQPRAGRLRALSRRPNRLRAALAVLFGGDAGAAILDLEADGARVPRQAERQFLALPRRGAAHCRSDW